MPQPSYQPGKPSTQMKRFTNREDQQSVFARFLNLPAGALPRLPALMFCGVGGIGKSWLLHNLKDQLLKIWAGVPSVRIDFTKEGASNRLRDDSMATLAEIRKIVNDAPCPRFDLAYAFLQVRRGVWEQSALAHGGRTTAWQAANEVIKGGLSLLPGGVGLTLGWTLLEKIYPHIKKRTGLDKVARIFEKDVQPLHDQPLEEIEKTLVWRLAEDLKEAKVLPLRTDRAVKGVIFIDTLEALEPIDATDFNLDLASKWLRDLISSLNDRILFVMAGQNKLNWEKFHSDWADRSWLEQHLVSGLSAKDARDFLDGCDIHDRAIQEAMLSRCLVTGGGYHSFHIGLLADLAWVERDVNHRPLSTDLFLSLPAGDWNKLALRFLKALENRADADWVRKLALTPEFDEQAARAAHSLHWSQLQDTAWQMLQSFSFVTEAEKRSGWNTINSAMQCAVREDSANNPRGTRAVHEWWREYWQQRTTDPSDQYAQLSWYHRWQLDSEEATAYWAKMAKAARSQAPPDMALHYRLLSWWQPLNPLEKVSWNSADASASKVLVRERLKATLGDRTKLLELAIELCKKVLGVYTREAFPQEWAETQNNLGVACSDLPIGDRDRNLRRAIECYRLALEVWTQETFPQDRARAQNNLGNAYSRLPTGDRDRNLRQAIECYRLALEVRTQEAFPQDWAATQNNMGLAYMNLPAGDRDRNLQQAIECYRLALEVWTQETFPQEWAETQNNLSAASELLGDQAWRADPAAARDWYEQSLKIRQQLAEAEPDNANARSAFALACARLAVGLKAGGDLAQATKRYQKALEVSTEAERLSPGNHVALYNRACIHAVWGDSEQALRSLRQAVEVGYNNADWAANDPDYTTLRDMQEFQRLLSRMRQKRGGI